MTGAELRHRREALCLGRSYVARKADGVLPINTQMYLECPDNFAVLTREQAATAERIFKEKETT